MCEHTAPTECFSLTKAHCHGTILLSAALLAIFLCLSATAATSRTGPGLQRFELNGQWELSQAGSNDWMAATVPGCVHTDLLGAGRIPDPFFRDNESKLQWIGEKDWTYRRSFVVTKDLLSRQHVLLRCEGLNTFANVRLNGIELGKTDNMFRTWEFDARRALKEGTNTVEVEFTSVLPFVRERDGAKHLPTWTYPGTGYVRKTPCEFGWDWGPTLITSGIWRDIGLVAFDAARLDDVQILQDHSKAGAVGLKVSIKTGPAAAQDLSARITLQGPGASRSSAGTIPLKDGNGSLDLAVEKPQLWWPADMGAQPLYTVRVELLDERGDAIEQVTKRIGLRTLELVPQTETTPLQMRVNGKPFFAKGACYIPSDIFPNRVTTEKLRRLVADAAAVHMNSLRFWGGGYYEEDALFDACDEMGICVWMDLKFACTTYPAFDPGFLQSVRQEAVDNVKRLRHHPSIAVWCGNNEIQFFRGKEWVWIADPSKQQNEAAVGKMSEADYNLLFTDTLGGVVRSLAPQCAYVSGSPDCGDVHYWEVWHGGKPFTAYGDIHGFMSEFGFQSFPVPKTVNTFTRSEDRTNVYSPIVRYHERSNRMYLNAPEDGTTGTDKMMKLVRENFGEPADFESTLWLSQINQAFGIEYAVGLWRREMPKSMGALYWQYNDDWPGTSWSSVDYFGRWKALQYRARHFYAPTLVSGVYNPTTQAASLWLTSDEMEPYSGTLRWRVASLDGTKLFSDQKSVTMDPRTSREVAQIDLKDLVRRHGATNLVVWLDLQRGKQAPILSYLLLGTPGSLALQDPGLSFKVSGKERKFTVTLSSQRPAFWAWADLPGADARFSDNFVAVEPGQPAVITVEPAKSMTRDEVQSQLKVRTVLDTLKK